LISGETVQISTVQQVKRRFIYCISLSSL